MRWPEPPPGRAIWALVAVFLALGALYSVMTPLFEASDELWHYPFVQHLAQGGRLPVQDPAAPGPWRQEGSQPPLYYALAALITRPVPAGDLDQLLVRNPHADIGIPRPDGNANMVVHGPLEAWPWRGAALAVHLARLFSVLLGAVTVLFTHAIGREVLPGRPGLALGAAAVVAFTPMFLFISGSVNNDNLLVALATVAFWQTLRLLRLEPTPGRWALLGLLVGLAALAKASGLALLAPAGLALAWVAWRRRDPKILLWGGACVGGTAALVAGWWYWRNWALYRDPLGLKVFVAIVGPRHPRPTLLQLAGEWRGFVMAYWGFFGGLNVAAPTWFYRVFNAIALLGAGGLAVGALRRLWSRRALAADVAFRLGLVVAWPLIVTASLVRWTLMTIASQGRLIFPAISALSYLLVLGLASWGAGVHHRDAESTEGNGSERDKPGFSEKPGLSRITYYVLRIMYYASRIILPLAVACFAALALWAPFAVIAPAYARPRLLTVEELAAIPHRLDVTFGGQMDLLGYRVEASQVKPGQELPVTLYWRARAPMAEDYSVFVHLLGENDLILGQRDLYPGRGTFPTSRWRPGDAIADTYVIPVSPTAFSPSQALLEVGLYRQRTGERLSVSDAQGRPLGDQVRFARLLVRAEPRDGIANPLYVDFDHKIALVGYDLDRTALQPGEALHLTLYWKALSPMARNYTVFAQVVGPNHSLWAQKDDWPLAGAAPTSTWRPGQLFRDPYELVVRPETPAGVYELQVGFYLADTLERLPVLGPGGHLQDNRVLLNRIRVVRP